MESSILSPQEIRRYQRHIMLPELGLEGQEKLKKAKVLVVGAGGLGSPALQYLAAAGVGYIGISDNDLVNESNLQRQILYGGHDLGKQKAIIAKQRLKVLNPLITYEIHNIFLNSDNNEILCKNYDIIVDATDNFKTRYLLSDTCVKLGKPLVYGSIYKFEGQISVFNYKGGPSLRDFFPEEPKNDATPDPGEIGVVGVLPGVIGTLQANEVIKIITGAGEITSGIIFVINVLNLSNYFIHL